MAREVHLFALRASGASAADFAAAIRAAGRDLGARTTFSIGEVMGEFVHADATAGAPRPADAILTWSPVAALARRRGRAGDSGAAPGLLDRGSSTLFLGERYDIVPGSGAVLISFALQRLARLDREGFQTYWLEHHAEHGRRTLIPPNTYSQIHARPADASLEALSAALSVPLDTRDGIAECLFPDLPRSTRRWHAPKSRSTRSRTKRTSSITRGLHSGSFESTEAGRPSRIRSGVESSRPGGTWLSPLRRRRL